FWHHCAAHVLGKMDFLLVRQHAAATLAHTAPPLRHQCDLAEALAARGPELPQPTRSGEPSEYAPNPRGRVAHLGSDERTDEEGEDKVTGNDERHRLASAAERPSSPAAAGWCDFEL